MGGLRTDNHFVPQLYLKQWAVGDKVQTYRLLVPTDKEAQWKPRSLSRVAFEQHLYTRVIGGQETDDIERWLHEEFENPADEPLGRAVRGEPLTPGDWRALIRFAVAQDVRTTARLKAFLAEQTESLPSLMQETLDESVQRFEVDSGARSETFEPPDPSNPFPLKVTFQRNPEGGGSIKTEMVVGRSFWLWSLQRNLTTTIKAVPTTGWTILHAPEDLSWPTSDNPVVRLNFTDASRYDFGGGWGVRNVDILLPLSPKHLMFTSIGKRPALRGTTLDVHTARLIQKIIVEHAHRHVFSRAPFDVQSIRERVVSLDGYNRERNAWRNWGREQAAAELAQQAT